MLVSIEQRLQDPSRILILPADEAVLLGFPILMGLLGRDVVSGIVIGLVAWGIWRRLKGEGGLERVLAGCYWFIPSAFGVFRPLPDSAVDVWEA